MKLETRYYIARRTEDGLIKTVHEETGPYYNCTVLINSNGYATQEDALHAVECYIKEHGWKTTYTFMVLEELTMSEDN